MGIPADKVANYEDLFGLPDNVVGEIFGGELVTHPRPAPKHALASSMVGAQLITKFGSERSDGGSGWWILFQPECHLGADIVAPDIDNATVTRNSLV